MLDAQKARQAANDAHKEFRVLVGKEDSTSEDIEKATKELNDLETRAEALERVEPVVEPVKVAPTEDAAARELRSLTGKVNVGNIFAAVVNHRAVDGPEKELQEHFGVASNEVPLSLLEERAVATVPADIESTTAPTVRPVFASGDAAFLGVRMATAGVGDQVFPVLTTRPSVGGPHKGDQSVAVTDAVFTAEALSPGRLQASYEYRRTDAARFSDLDGSLRSATSEGLSEALDKELIDQIVADVGRTDSTANVDTFATYRSRLVYGLLDGRYAKMESDIRLLMGAKTAVHASGLYRGNTADDSAIDSLRRVSGGVRISAHVAPVSGTKQDVIVRRGSSEDAVVALWPSVALIPDEITGAKTGKIVLTGVLLAAFSVLRTDGFARVQLKHS